MSRRVTDNTSCPYCVLLTPPPDEHLPVHPDSQGLPLASPAQPGEERPSVSAHTLQTENAPPPTSLNGFCQAPE